MWSKLDDKFPDHPKIVQAGPLASWLYVCGVCYANRYLTDGFIPMGQIRKLADVDDAPALAARLVAVNLWEVVDGGYFIHDFHDVNMTAEEARQRRDEISEKRAEAGKKGAIARWQNGKIDSKVPSKPDSKNMAPNQNQNQYLEPEPINPPNPPPGGSAAEANFQDFFDEFWGCYPKKIQKQAAMKAARRIAARDRDEVVQAARHYSQSTRVLKGYCKDPPGFLKDAFWKDYVDGPQIEEHTNGHKAPGKGNTAADAAYRNFEDIARRTRALAGDNDQRRLPGPGKDTA
jgi:hypothetical protein